MMPLLKSVGARMRLRLQQIRGRRTMREIILAGVLSIAVSATAVAQSDQDLRDAGRRTDEIITYGMNYTQQRFSPLGQINRDTVRRLVPAWSYSMANNYGEEAQPLIKEGVIYITDHDKTVAIDALVGKELWKTMVEYPSETTRVVCCGIVNRGAALYQGKVFRVTLDARIIALDQKNGNEIWSTRFGDPKFGTSGTGAPLIANGVVIIGAAGAEYGIRGFLDGYDPQTGERLWRHFTVPLPGEPGSDTWPDNAKRAKGGSSWTTGSYDPELDMVFWGIGNPAPWDPLDRKGDNLFTDTIMALRPKTGEMVWYYQMSPNDPFDHDGGNALVQAELIVQGKPTKVVMQAGRNGFFYVLERATGKLVAANKYVKVTWADHIDMETGRPVWSEATKEIIQGPATVVTYPNIAGGTNWFPMSYSPLTGLAYVNTINQGVEYRAAMSVDELQKLQPGESHRGLSLKPIYEIGRA